MKRLLWEKLGEALEELAGGEFTMADLVTVMPMGSWGWVRWALKVLKAHGFIGRRVEYFSGARNVRSVYKLKGSIEKVRRAIREIVA